MNWFISNQHRQAPSVDPHDTAAAKPSIDFLNSDISGDIFDQTPLTDTDSDDSEGTARGISTSDLVSRNGRPTDFDRALAQLERHWSRGERHGLTTAALLVKECKTQMRTHPAEALIAFIHACWHSPFAVSFMKHSVDKLVRCIELLENNITSDQLQAAQCRVLGFTARAMLAGYRDIEALYTPEGVLENQPAPLDWFLVHQAGFPKLGAQEVLWVLSCGRFRIHWNLLSDSDTELWEQRIAQRQEGQTDPLLPQATPRRRQEARAEMHKDAQHMLRNRRHHPASLQALRLCVRAVEEEDRENRRHDRGYKRLRDEERRRERESMVSRIGQVLEILRDGYQYVLRECPDPATAIQHLLLCMFLILTDCKGRPEEELTAILRQTADNVLVEYGKLTHLKFGDSTAWEIVSDRLVPSMLLLSRLFNMPKLLPDHKLPPLLKQEVLNAHKLALQATATDQAPSEDSSSSDSDNMVEHRCTHCRKKHKEVEMYICQKCRRAIYCNEVCAQRDAKQHGKQCLRHQLRVKQEQSSK